MSDNFSLWRFGSPGRIVMDSSDTKHAPALSRVWLVFPMGLCAFAAATLFATGAESIPWVLILVILAGATIKLLIVQARSGCREFAVNLLFLGSVALSLSACGPDDSAKSTGPQFAAKPPSMIKEYVFAIHPLHNPVRLFEVYGPMIEYLNRSIPEAAFRLEASRNYEEFEKKLYLRKFDFALPNPYQTLSSMKHGYHVIAKMGDDANFTGIILVRRDSGIRTVADLKGKKISYPAPSALAATMMPQYFLQTHGLDVNHDIVNLYVGSQESSIMNVLMGQTAAGATWPLPWMAFQKEHPDQASQLEIKWETEPLINNGVVARDDVPDVLEKRVAQQLASMHSTDEGKAILARMPLSRFELADDRRYHVIKEFLHKFSQRVRPLDKQ